MHIHVWFCGSILWGVGFAMATKKAKIAESGVYATDFWDLGWCDNG